MDLLFGGPSGAFLLRDVRLEPGVRLLATLDPEEWRRIDASGAFGLANAERGPTAFGDFPPDDPVRLEAEPGDELRAWLGDRDLPAILAEIESADPRQFPRYPAAWRALHVTREHSPGLRAGFSVSYAAPPEVQGIRDAVAVGMSPLPGLDGGWDDLADHRPALHTLAAWAAVATDEERDVLLAWLAERTETQAFWEVLLSGWPPWVRARAHRFVAAACRPGGAWPRDLHGVVERRLDEANCRGEWAAYLIDNHLYDGAVVAVADTLSRGAVLPASAVSALAAAVTSWAKDLLIDASRAMGRGGGVGRTRWRTALIPKIPVGDARWALVDAALDEPLPTVEVYDRGFD